MTRRDWLAGAAALALSAALTGCEPRRGDPMRAAPPNLMALLRARSRPFDLHHVAPGTALAG